MKLLTVGIVLGVLYMGHMVNTTFFQSGKDNVDSVEVALGSIYEAKIGGLEGGELDFSDFEKSPILIVNVASRCGYTYQYEDLQTLYETYKDKGLVVVGVPSNDFMGQEPGTDSDIKEFCQANYGVSFPMTTKLKVSGKAIHPLYKYLIDNTKTPKFSGKITWNFNKFLINKKGEVIKWYGSGVKPMSNELVADIEREL